MTLPAECFESLPTCCSTPWSVLEPGVGAEGMAGKAGGIIYRREHHNITVTHQHKMTHHFLILMQLVLHLHRGQQLPTGNLQY